MESLIWALDLVLVACACLWALREDQSGARDNDKHKD